MGVQLPEKLRALLVGSPLEAPALRLVEKSSEILLDNKTPFFPAYTDHGREHVDRVLAAAIRLIPEEVWSKGLLGPADAAILICASCLHDLGLHVREEGFLELISESSGFRPLPWFDRASSERAADRPWSVLWQSFRKEARHFTVSQLDSLLGPQNEGVPAVAYGDADTHPALWTEADRLLVGEFLRRHHARLSHEIAIYGFPGAGTVFPAFGQELPDMADAIGATARSHGEDLRTAVAYLDYRHAGTRRPAGALLPYLMGILRIADYFQLDSDRAPLLLLRMKHPQSRQSIDEWAKHRSIASISWDHKDPAAFYVEVSAAHGLRTHLQLRELFVELQHELDATTGVLSELYALAQFSTLRLARQRIRTNLDEPALHDRLPFIPRRATLRSAEDLFRLVTRDLYGGNPVVAGRELLQNAADAMAERRHWEARNDHVLNDSEFRGQSTDVVIEIIENAEEEFLLRIADRGIGMTPELLIDYFLTAGASHGGARSDATDTDGQNTVEVRKAGRFGVGVFAAFLLGSEVRVKTRHLEAERGISLVARLDDDLVELDWCELPFGSEITVPIAQGRLTASNLGERPYYDEEFNSDPKPNLFLSNTSKYFKLRSPSVSYQIRSPNSTERLRLESDTVPTPGQRLPDGWRTVSTERFDAILWRVPPDDWGQGEHRLVTGQFGAVTHNGIRICRPDSRSHDDERSAYGWAMDATRQLIGTPDLAVFDRRHRLGLSLTRYHLTEPNLPFERELLESIGEDILARAITLGTRQHPLADEYGLWPILGRSHWLPLMPDLVGRYASDEIYVLWTLGGSGSKASGHFISDKLRASDWTRMPFRAVVGLTIANFGDTTLEQRGWQLNLDTFAGDTQWFGQLLKRDAVSLVAVRHNAFLKRGRKNDTWRAIRGSLGSGFSTYWSDVEATHSTTEKHLLSVAREMVPMIKDEVFAITAFSRPKRVAEDFGHPLATAWMSMLDGGVARDERARRAQKDALIKQHPRLRVPVNKWSRLARRQATK
jgi:molecular chaperone HtpG